LTDSVHVDGWMFSFVGGWHYDRDGLVVEENHFQVNFVDLVTDWWGTVREFDDAGRMRVFAEMNLEQGTMDMTDIVHSELGRDPAGRVVSENRLMLGWDPAAANTQVVFSVEGYEYDPAGQLRKVIDPGSSATLAEYTYDVHGRRRAHTVGAATVDYVWNDVGELERLEPDVGDDTVFAYDGAGRRVEQGTGGVSTTYSYDPAGRLQERERAENTTSVWDEQRSYDPAGTLAAVEVDTPIGDTDTTLVWDPTAGVPQLSGWHTQTGAGSRHHQLSRGRGGEPIAVDFDTIANDPHGSNLAIRGTGIDTLAAAVRFDAYGSPATFDGTGPAELPDEHVYLGYRGEIHTHDLIHLRNRDYDPATATFTTPDPLDGVNGTTVIANPYHYTDNNPLNKTDPLGLRPGESGADRGSPPPMSCSPTENLLHVNAMTLADRVNWFDEALTRFDIVGERRTWFSNIDGILEFFTARGLAEPGQWTSIVDSNILLAIVQGAAWSAGCKPRGLTPGAADWSVFFDVLKASNPSAEFGSEDYLRLAAIWGRAEQAATDGGIRFAAEFFNNHPTGGEKALLIEFGDYYRSVVGDISLLRENRKILGELQLICVTISRLIIDACVEKGFSIIERFFDPRSGGAVAWMAGLVWDNGWESAMVTLLVPK
jgi:RHS repeat-associated protein